MATQRTPAAPTSTVTTADPGRADHVRALARLLDAAVTIPGTNIRVGLDALIGLVPGVGDMAGAAMSGYIVLAAARLGAPTPVLLRMLLNIGVDGVIGSVPLLGDLFDVGWRANLRNTALLDAHLAAPERTRRASGGIVAGVVVALVLLAAGAIALTFAVLRLIVGLFTG